MSEPLTQDTEAAAEGRALVVIDEEVGGRELTRSLADHLGDGIGQIFVVAPALPDSNVKLLTGDVDDAVPPARRRLEKTLAHLREAGMEARGEVADSDPIQAMSDEIVKFEPDEVLLVAHRDGNPVEKGLLERAERDFDVPVLEIVVERAAEPAVLDVQSTSPGAERGLDSRGPYFLPKSTSRDTLSIIVGVIGTGVLIVLAALAMGNQPSGAANHHEGRLGADVVAMMLLAGAFFLINVGNIIGMVLFQGIRFQGFPARFFAWTTLATPLAIAASVVLLIVSSH